MEKRKTTLMLATVYKDTSAGTSMERKIKEIIRENLHRAIIDQESIDDVMEWIRQEERRCEEENPRWKPVEIELRKMKMLTDGDAYIYYLYVNRECVMHIVSASCIISRKMKTI